MLIYTIINFAMPLAQYAYEYGDPGSSGFYASPSMYAMDSTTLLGLGLLIATGIIGMLVQSRMMSSMRTFSAETAPLTGAEVARRMLDAHGLYDVQITHVPGQLSDHYNPANRTVNLSDVVFSHATVAAMAVAAHECGHAVQHATSYPWLSLRSNLVPMVNIGSRLGQFILLTGIALAAAGAGTTVAWVGLTLYAGTTLFAFVTLPVEFDASRRALAWLQKSGLARDSVHAHASSALRWAAMTYVSAALSSIAMLLYYALRLLAMRSDSRR